MARRLDMTGASAILSAQKQDMNLITEYVNRNLSGPELEAELLKLIGEYNLHRGTYLFVYATAFNKPVREAGLVQEDYYTFSDMLSGRTDVRRLDVYLETPGGSGETAEEIVRFLRGKFECVHFVVSGEAKSAGTIMALSGDEILMTGTGSLGPIDAQIMVGRSRQSASDYMEWVTEKRAEAAKVGRLNPFDATMVAQITPGELQGAFHALKFAEDLVVDWLQKYKFKNWTETKTRKLPVTAEMRLDAAKRVATALNDHARWRSHGRSIKAIDFDDIGLDIVKVEADAKLADLVYRIQTVCRFLFEKTSTFKVFATAENKLFKAASSGIGLAQPGQAAVPDVAQLEVKCPKCGTVHKIYAKFVPNPKIDKDMRAKGFAPFPKDARLVCSCGFETDLSGLKSELELKAGKAIIV
jgi:phage FluMu protein Com